MQISVLGLRASPSTRGKSPPPSFGRFAFCSRFPARDAFHLYTHCSAQAREAGRNLLRRVNWRLTSCFH